MQLKGTLYYYAVNMRYMLMIFWGIMLGILLLSLVSDMLFGGDKMDIYYSFSIPTYAFAAAVGFWVVKNIIPYLVKMGITRLSIYLGTGIMFLFLVIFNGTIANTMEFLGSNIIGSDINSGVNITFGNKNISSTSALIELFAKDTLWNRFVIDVSIQFFALAVGFMFGMIFYRYKLIGGASVFALLLFIFIYSINSGWLYDTAVNIISNFSMLFFYQLFGVALVIYLLTHFLFRKLTI